MHVCKQRKEVGVCKFVTGLLRDVNFPMSVIELCRDVGGNLCPCRRPTLGLCQEEEFFSRALPTDLLHLFMHILHLHFVLSFVQLHLVSNRKFPISCPKPWLGSGRDPLQERASVASAI